MLSRRARTTRDYNRGLPAPVLWAHVALAILRDLWDFTFGPTAGWAVQPVRRAWALPLLLAPVLFVVLFPFDQAISDLAAAIPLGGDVKRELHAWQQYGALGSLVFTALLIWLLDPARTRRLLDLVAAVAVTGLAVTLMKVVVGRARPGFVREVDHPDLFVPLWAQYPVPFKEDGETVHRIVHAWEAGARLWSMPSSHTAYAVVLSIFLAALYPRLRWLALAMAVLVGVCRVLFGAHYPSDVAVGACVALAIAIPAIRQSWGVRTLDWFWARFIERGGRASAA